MALSPDTEHRAAVITIIQAYNSSVAYLFDLWTRQQLSQLCPPLPHHHEVEKYVD